MCNREWKTKQMSQMMGRWGKKEDRNSPVGAWFVMAREVDDVSAVDDPNAFMKGPPFVAETLYRLNKELCPMNFGVHDRIRHSRNARLLACDLAAADDKTRG
jgi:hypothetical protein